MSRKWTILAVVAVMAAFLSGCGQETRIGVVAGDAKLRSWWGGYAPEIPVCGPDGKVTTLNDAAGPLFILAFVRPGGEGCAAMSPDVRKLADELRVERVNVVQVTLPSETCPRAPTDLASVRPAGWNQYLFFDPRGSAWRAFDSPPEGTLLLIDDFRYVVTTGTLADPRWIVSRAEDKARDWDRRQLELHSGDRNGGGRH